MMRMISPNDKHDSIKYKTMNKADVVIILGTAHLATTPGKQSPDGRLKEYEYSRRRVEAIKAKLKAYGYTVFVDYEPQEPNEFMASSNVKTQQNRELEYRATRVNSLCKLYGTNNCIYVSIHVNAAPDNGKSCWMTAGGWSAYTSKGRTKADLLAECIYDAARKNLEEYAKMMDEGKAKGLYGAKQVPLRTDMSDGDSDIEEDFYVLKHTKCPAVLTENLFMNCKADVDFLLSEAGKHAIERLHVEGIMKYITEN